MVEIVVRHSVAKDDDFDYYRDDGDNQICEIYILKMMMKITSLTPPGPAIGWQSHPHPGFISFFSNLHFL